MSSQQSSGIDASTISEDDVVHFLDANPAFFEDNPALLSVLRLPHQSGGGTVSLVEKQLAVLRQKNRKLEARLGELVEIAKANHELSDRVHGLAISLIIANGPQEVIDSLETALREDFGASDSVVVLFHDASNVVQHDDTRFVRRVARTDAALKPFGTFLEQAAPRCGKARDAQLNFLFPEHAIEIGSIALIPLGEESTAGMLAIGSHDADRFHPGMQTDFLERLGEIVGVALDTRGR
jgi:uncharacterized protein YigA (DUF484 family)